MWKGHRYAQSMNIGINTGRGGGHMILVTHCQFAYTKYTEFSNQSIFEGGLEQTSISLISEK